MGQIIYSDRASVFAFLGCFSCELYLKFIIACEKWDKKKPVIDLQYGHILDNLFNHSLSQECKQAIHSKVINSGVVSSEQEFNECLSACSDGFVKWRYYFETEIDNPEDSTSMGENKIEIRTSFLVELSNALADYSNKLFERINYEFDSDEAPFIELI